MWTLLLKQLIIPLAVDSIKSYVKNTDSSKDDKVLEVVQVGASYLAKKTNNTVSKKVANSLESDSIRNKQG